MDTKVAKGDLIYLYCITDRMPNLKELEKVADYPYFIHHRGLYAIVNKVRESEFSEENLKRNLGDLEWIEVRASIHEKVIEGIMQNACVIPFKFGTLFATEDNVKAMLSRHLEEFRDMLKRLEDKEEWGIKIYCDLEKLKANLLQEDEELLTLDRQISSSSPGKAYLLKKKNEELVNVAANKKLNQYSQVAFDKLREKSLEARINKLLPEEVTERKDEMILNSSFLVDKNKVDDFLGVVEDLRTKYSDRGLFFDCTGPWPPYNFCNPLKDKETQWIE